MTEARGSSRPARAVGEPVELVLFDVGGPIYDDACYARALLRATVELATRPVAEADFWRVYDEVRERQSGGLRRTVAERFRPDGGREALSRLAQRYWEYPASALHPDVPPATADLARRYRLGVVANQRARVLDALSRDGLLDRFDVLAISQIVGVEKPDPAIFRYALDRAGVPAARAVHVGNRLDTDVRAARRVGLRTVWMLRGEAPAAPTTAQLAEPDAVVRSCAEVAASLDRLAAP